MGMGKADNFTNRIDRAKGIGNLIHCNQAGLLVEHVLKQRQVELAVFVKRQNAKGCAAPQAHLLPGDVVAVVLKLRNNDLIPRMDKLFAEGICQQVNRLRRAASEDYFMVVLCIDIACHLPPCPLVSFGSLHSQGVIAAMDIGIQVGVIINQRVDHHLWFLGGSGIIKVDQRVVIDGLLQ